MNIEMSSLSLLAAEDVKIKRNNTEVFYKNSSDIVK